MIITISNYIHFQMEQWLRSILSCNVGFFAIAKNKQKNCCCLGWSKIVAFSKETLGTAATHVRRVTCSWYYLVSKNLLFGCLKGGATVYSFCSFISCLAKNKVKFVKETRKCLFTLFQTEMFWPHIKTILREESPAPLNKFLKLLSVTICI